MKKNTSTNFNKSILLFLFFTSQVLLSYAQPGTLDNTFGNKGTIYLPSPVGTGVAKAALQKDNKIVTVGYYSGTELSRFLDNGNLDSSFGENGQVALHNFESVECIAIQNDGKILVGGTHETGDVAIKLMRFLPDGTFDASFGENGIVTDNLGGQAGASGITIQPDGKIVVTGFWADPNDQTIRVYSSVARYNEDGSPDLTFGKEGSTVFKSWATDTNARTVAIGKDGKIYIGGDNNMQLTTDLRFFVGCVKPDGEIDSSFDGDGMVFTNVSKDGEYVSEIAVQDDGKIVATGTSHLYRFGVPYNPTIALVRYNSNGSLDASFGKSGIVEFAVNNKSLGNSIAFQKNGKILIGGLSLGNDAIDKFSVTRFLPDGSLDSSFGTYGYAMPDFVGGNAKSVLLQNDGRIVLAGEPSISLARYLGDPTHPVASHIKRWIKNHILHFEDENNNTAYFTIEQQTSNGSYKQIASLNATSANQYSYTLPPSANETTYRIKAVNKDNSFTYTQPIQDISDDAATISVSPNPATNTLNISGLQQKTKYEVQILNKQGIPVVSSVNYHLSSVNSKINISTLQNGIYFLKIKDDIGNQTTLKFIKQ